VITVYRTLKRQKRILPQSILFNTRSSQYPLDGYLTGTQKTQRKTNKNNSLMFYLRTREGLPPMPPDEPEKFTAGLKTDAISPPFS